jgi:hypothetical protein
MPLLLIYVPALGLMAACRKKKPTRLCRLRQLNKRFLKKIAFLRRLL